MRAIEVSIRELQVQTLQIGFFGQEAVERADAGAMAETAAAQRVAICGTFVAFDREDYSSIESIGRTGGLMADAEYSARRETFRRAAAITEAIARASAGATARVMAIHVGTLLVDQGSNGYAALVLRAREFADVASAHGLRLLFETGRESAENLAAFIATLDRANVGVNFDPANFVIYGTDDPVKAIAHLKALIELVHLKDATRSPGSAGAGAAFGRPAAFGHGDVQIPRVVSKLRAAGYSGPMLVETPQQAGLPAIRDAVRFLQSML